MWFLVIQRDGTRIGFTAEHIARIVAKMYPGSRVEMLEPVLRWVQGRLFERNEDEQ